MSKQIALELRRYRTLTGAARKVAIRDYLKAQGVDFAAHTDVHTMSWEHRQLVATVAKAVGFRKSIGSPFSLGTAYFVYLSRGV
jgi:hypothetical protein